MSIIFALRADNASYAARYSTQSTSALQIGAGTISYDTDATAINGHCINMDQGAAGHRILSYPFRGVHTNKQISVLVRINLGNAALTGGIWSLGCAANFTWNNMQFYQLSSTYRMTSFNNAESTVLNGSFGAATSSGVWTDVVVTWDGTTSANKLKVWVDGTATSVTASAAWPTSLDHDFFNIGSINTSTVNTQMKIEEVVIWNTEIDPTSVTLDSGTGSLNGASRTSLVSVSALNGGSYSDPGASNVRSGTSYTYAGTSTTGTLVSSSGVPKLGKGIF